MVSVCSCSPLFTARPSDHNVDCKPACPADCQTPVTPYVNWDNSDCPKPGEAWKEDMVSSGCKVQCANSDQSILVTCKEGLSTLDPPDAEPCPPAQWEPNDGPCSASCGGGTFTRNWYCASETKRDEDCDPDEKPKPSVETCATNHCYGSAPEKRANNHARRGGAVAFAHTRRNLVNESVWSAHIAALRCVDPSFFVLSADGCLERGRRARPVAEPVAPRLARTSARTSPPD